MQRKMYFMKTTLLTTPLPRKLRSVTQLGQQLQDRSCGCEDLAKLIVPWPDEHLRVMTQLVEDGHCSLDVGCASDCHWLEPE